MDIQYFLFGVYPYIALSVFLLGSLIRFDREQYSWKADSSQLLDRKTLRMGSNLFHIGILALFCRAFGGAVGTTPGISILGRFRHVASIHRHHCRCGVRQRLYDWWVTPGSVTSITV